MIFRSACPTSALAAWCRALQHGLGVGFTPGKVLRQQARSGPAALRDVAARLADRLDTGDSLREALLPEVGRFPVLFVESVSMGEQAGRLAEVLEELEQHYTDLTQARSRLLFSLIWPGFSIVAGIVVITIMYLILGAMGLEFDPLGLGLTGYRAAILFPLICFGVLFGLAGIISTFANDEQLKSKALGAAILVPGFAGCVRAFALQRFSMAWHFMAEAGMKADRTMAVSLRATANRAYREREESSAKSIRKGAEVVDVLAEAGDRLFPEDFVEAARIGEETGQLAEVMRKQARHYQEESERKLRTISFALTAMVWCCYLLIMIMAIFRMSSNALDPYQNPDLKALNRQAGFPE